MNINANNPSWPHEQETAPLSPQDSGILPSDTVSAEDDYEEDEAYYEDLEREFLEDDEAYTLTGPAGEILSESIGTLTICGRPNVGKSSLINRILARREAVVEDKPGVTRDRVKYQALWNGRRFTVEDTGGWEPKPSGVFFSVKKHAELAINTADVVVFVVDSRVGITSDDEQLAKIIRKSGKPVLLVVNKADSPQLVLQAAEFWSLGLGEPYPISATHGSNVADLLDLAVELLLKNQKISQEAHDHYRRVALVGKPNVGKSSLLNKMAKENKAIVSPMAGTTVDPVDSLVQLDDAVWKIVDTAGLKKQYHFSKGHEYYATLRTESAIEAAEVALVLIDASESLTEQDLRIISLVAELGRALVIVFNKWDNVDEERRYYLDKEIDLQLDRVTWAKKVNISATTGRNVHRLESAMVEALQSWEQRVTTGHLNQWLRSITSATPPPARGGKIPRILFITQAGTCPPTFVIFCTGFVEAGYRRFLERKLRESFGFAGTPIKITMKIREKRNKRK